LRHPFLTKKERWRPLGWLELSFAGMPDGAAVKPRRRFTGGGVYPALPASPH
jgi:hypothetical protein